MTKEEYAEFFKLTFKEFLDPLATAHFNVEGTIEFKAMLFVPGMAPFEQQVWPGAAHRVLAEGAWYCAGRGTALSAGAISFWVGG